MTNSSPIDVAVSLRQARALVFVTDLEIPSIDMSDAHHLVGVLRLRPDESVIASDGKGSFRTCVLGSSTPSHLRQRNRSLQDGLSLEATGSIHKLHETSPPVSVGFAMAKGDRSEWAVQKLVELGVDEIWPLIAKRSVVRLDPAEASRRGQKLAKVAREAASQSRRVYLPKVHDPASFENFCLSHENLASSRSIALAEPEGNVPQPGLTSIIVGPEGGWAQDELDRIALHVTLSDAILRVETAAVAAGVILCCLRAGFMPPKGHG